MDRATKGFILSSLIYFAIAAGLGLWMGIAAPPEWVEFGHVHFNLLGFMAMMVYGVGYFILPRFNGRELKWPALLPIHLVIANLGLIGMVATSPERPSAGFVIFALLSVLSALMFAIHIGVTILETVPAEEQEESGTGETGLPQLKIGPDTRVGDILTRWPESVDVFVNNGFAPLADPEHREQVKQLPVTLGMACSRHNIDVNMMVQKLNEAVGGSGGTGPAGPTTVSLQGTLQPGAPVAPHHIIGNVLKVYPATKSVFKKYYGGACFSCPGQATETIRQSALLHNVKEKDVLADLNRAAGISSDEG